MKHFLTSLCIMIILQFSLFAQTIVDVPSDPPGSSGSLNNAIQSAIDGGTLSSTVFNLEAYGYYVLSGWIEIPLNQHLQITAPDPGTTQNEALPQIVWTADNSVNTDYFFRCFGDLSMKNVWLRYANEGGVQKGSQIRFIGDTLGTAEVRGNFEDVIFDYSPCPSTNASGSVTVTANHFVGHFTNCYWKNCIDTHLRYYGRAVSFPYQSTKWHIDTLTFENCTFANMGYVYMQEESEFGDNVHFNHCTFLNVVVHTLESGQWYKMSVTNSLLVNTQMYGTRPLDGDSVSGGLITGIDSIVNFSRPETATFGEQDRRILLANDSYGIQPWLVEWMANSPWAKYLHSQRRDDEIPEPCPMLNPPTLEFLNSTDFPYMNQSNLYDGALPRFVLPPTALDSLKSFLNHKWDDNKDLNWAWQRDDGYFQIWPLPEDLSYANDTLKTAAMGGFPLGDLYRWWPDQYAQWKAQEDAEHTRINTWLETGTDPGAVDVREVKGSAPSVYKLSQNYPNPFNPTTKIEYSVPKSGYVSLKVYNLLGQEVSTLFSGNQKVGNYIATFDGTGLASGIYLYRLQTDNVSITKKLVLMK